MIDKKSEHALMRPVWTSLGVFLAAFCLYFLFSNLISISDPVESNYVLTAKEMVLSSDWLSPRIYGNVWFDKPVFFYWLTAIAFKIFGFSEAAARLAPALFAALGVTLIYWFVTKISKQSVALLAAVVMGTSLEYGVLAKLVITDMVFFVFNSAALVFFYLGYRQKDAAKRWYAFMYVSLALAVLTKGPVGVLLPGIVIGVFIAVKCDWAELEQLINPVGIMIFLIIMLPWYLAMYAVHGAEFVDTFLGVHNYLRATVSEHPKDNVSYYYIGVFFLSMLPWSAIAVKAIVRECKGLRLQASPLILFSLIWTAVYFGFYSLMATKYLTYTFPILFPVAIITAVYLEQLFAQNKTRTIFFWVGIPLFVVVVGYMVIAFRYLEHDKLIAVIVGLVIILLFTLWQAKGREGKRIFGLLCLCQIISFILLSGFIFPGIAESRSGKGIGAIIANKPAYYVGMYQFYSTSSVYYSGNIPVKIEPASEMVSNQPDMAAWAKKYTMPIQTLTEFMAHSRKEYIMIIVPDKKNKEFLDEAKELRPKLLKNDEGFSYYYFED
ncbi:Undecaprenyl phosphate-alpha-4-amino-4-deoxy-L-arabinose arabinosyl transferase [bioreactor metagenome]|uniref:Undecaprenyl phosphate-alpha-4-amino-4-deoxy-L-arabinose arabinosyl transferase n=1 Tax=bioreactor metagenome TaxID=1076179 RepID=A0A644TQN5_9ZZZZ